VVIKKSDNTFVKVVMLKKQWARKNIPHFRPVIDGVTEEEGIEISLCCNLAAFEWIIKHLEANPAKESVNESEMENELIGLHE
jgi:hypothetical protein